LSKQETINIGDCVQTLKKGLGGREEDAQKVPDEEECPSV
jgi:hypothetical protein